MHKQEASRIDDIITNINNSLNKLEEYIINTKDRYKQLLSSIPTIQNVDQQDLDNFIKKPYYVLQVNENEAKIIVPKFVGLDFGIIEAEDESYRVYKVNKLLSIVQNIPDQIKEELGFEQHYNVDIIDDNTIYVKGDVNRFKKEYNRFIRSSIDDNTYKLKKTKKLLFEAYRRLLKDGILPYKLSPFPNSLLINEEKFKLRDYQQEAWDLFLKYSSITVFFPFGAGKSMLGLYALSRVKGNKLVIVNTNALKEQWNERIKKYNIKDVQVITYHVIDRYKKGEYSLIVYDEAHHAPSRVFSNVYWLNSKGRIGLTGSPFREDGNHELLFTLGYPVGANWSEFFRRKIVPKPTVNVIINNNKDSIIKDIVKKNIKTNTIIVFCDSIDKGKELTKILRKALNHIIKINVYGIRFVYSKTPRKLETIRKELENKGIVIISRVGDEGISMPDVDMIIEYDFLYGSRMQASQRLGRLMHSKSAIEGRYYILMTNEEYAKYKKRLNAYYEKGINVITQT